MLRIAIGYGARNEWVTGFLSCARRLGEEPHMGCQSDIKIECIRHKNQGMDAKREWLEDKDWVTWQRY